MAILCTDRVAIRGLSACVPSKIENTDKVYSKWGGGEQFASTVGVKQKRKASTHTTSADPVSYTHLTLPTNSRV